MRREESRTSGYRERVRVTDSETSMNFFRIADGLLRIKCLKTLGSIVRSERRRRQIMMELEYVNTAYLHYMPIMESGIGRRLKSLVRRIETAFETSHRVLKDREVEEGLRSLLRLATKALMRIKNFVNR